MVTDPRSHRRCRTPTVLQMEAVECGAAALAMILGYHGRVVPLEQLRIECGVSRDGSKAHNMVKAARKFGMVAKGFKKEPEQLRKMQMPAIVFWNFNHFLVVEGFGRGKVYLNDPASGPRVVGDKEFDESFTGVVLTFEPGPDFTPGGEQTSVMRGFARRLRGSERGVLYGLLAGLLLVLPGLVIPSFTRVFIDEIFVNGQQEWLQPLLLAMAAAVLVQIVLTALQQRCLIRLETKLALTASSRFFWHVLRLPMEFFAQRYGGEIGARVAANDRVASLLSGHLAAQLLALATVGFYLLLMVQYDVALALAGVAVAVANVAALRYVSRRRYDCSRALLQERGKLMGVAMGGLQMIETIKASGAEASFFARWAGHQAKVLRAEQALGLLANGLGAVPPLLMALNSAVILGIGGFRVMEGSLSIGELAAFQLLMASFLAPINALVGFGGNLQQAGGDMQRLDDVLRYPQDPLCDQAQAGKGFERIIKLSGEVELRDVTFGYSKLEPPLIEAFNIRIPAGSRVAIVGATGSGKSTVAKLIAGVFDPWAGEILFDGVNRKEIPRRLIANSLAVVDQDIFLFEDSVRANISMWDGTITDTELTRAARDACIDGVILSRPGGFDSRLEEGGVNFSGGQRQRLEIARALVMNPAILVLDEATSALDPVTERQIDRNLRRRGCTCIIVAHRLSTIRDADSILVLDGGKVVQAGTHEELKKDSSGLYAKLIEA